MTEYFEVVKALVNLGFAGALLFVVWRLVDRWAGQFLAAQKAQAEAMGKLAAAVEGSSGEQREVLLAVRVMAAKLDEVRGWVRELDEHIRGNGHDEGN